MPLIRNLTSGALGACVLFAAPACTGGSSLTPVPRATADQTATVPVSQPLALDSTLLGDRSAITVTVRTAKTMTTGSTGYDNPKGEYIVADILIECTTGTYHANPFSFGFVAQDGTKGTPTVSMFAPALEAVDLTAGQQASGTVVFDVPKGYAKGARIAVHDALGARDMGYWKL
ncbi:hypothetical protein Lfu02_14570 [Longispora fulva]|uniref:DUF4352 domain-containing protein n=1 Tax=Longispora fulva TaxID=619741 RepID=A0A8J7H2Z9_9ACTN|nr:DUF4352 domain-containing protein [Longispora fulva]MBG6140533.1 hypothetical protein [Longispora fulva]GIG57085.1 hypothetical protein Lfu02_14570 [Longispora fulva]